MKLQKNRAQVLCKMPLVLIIVENEQLLVLGSAGIDGRFRNLDEPRSSEYLLTRVREALQWHEQYCIQATEQARLRALYESTTRREREVMERLARGCTNKQIGADLGVSPRTVEIYRGRVLQKMQVNTGADLVRLWLALEKSADARSSPHTQPPASSGPTVQDQPTLG